MQFVGIPLVAEFVDGLKRHDAIETAEVFPPAVLFEIDGAGNVIDHRTSRSRRPLLQRSCGSYPLSVNPMLPPDFEGRPPTYPSLHLLIRVDRATGDDVDVFPGCSPVRVSALARSG